MADYTGRKLGGYELEKLLGKGAMGAVYLAVQTALGREVAVKVLDKSELGDESAVARFQGEARAVAALNHPNVMGVYDVGESDDCHYMAMELIDGESMGDAIRNGRRLDAEQILGFGAQAARGLAAAHDAGLIHRDIKPDNILLTSAGVAKVADFGLAREQESDIHLTQTGAVYGSPAYMSPEQCQGEKLTSASDIYSFGVTLYYVLSGHVPFDATSAVAVMMKHVTDQPQFDGELAENYPADLLRIIERCMAKVPGERWASAADLADALERVARGEAIPIDQTLLTSQFSGPIIVQARPAWFWPVAAVGALSVLSLIVAMFMFARGTSPDPGAGEADSGTTTLPPVTAGDPKDPGGDPPPDQGTLPGDGGSAATESGEPGAEVPPAPDTGKLVIDAMSAERKGELRRARELLEQAASASDLAAYSVDAAEILADLRTWEGSLAEGHQAIEAGELEQANAAIGNAHALYPGQETLTLRTELGLITTELSTVDSLVGRGDLARARSILEGGVAGEYASLYSPALERLSRYEAALATAERAVAARAWVPAEEGLALAASIWDNEALRSRIEEVTRHRGALDRAEAALAAGDLAAAESAYVEAQAAMDTSSVRELLVDVRFGAALAAAAAADSQEGRLAELERAHAIRADESLASEIGALREAMIPGDDDIVRDAMNEAEAQMASKDYAGALATLEQVSDQVTGASPDTRGQHASMLARARAGIRPVPARPQSIAVADRLFAEAEKLRKTPMTLFSDKNEQAALSKYERIISTYANSDKLGAAYFGAAHVAENLERVYKAVDYWEKAAQNGYRDPVECYLLAADCAEDDLDDESLARRLLQSALQVCRDGRRAKIQGKLRDL